MKLYFLYNHKIREYLDKMLEGFLAETAELSDKFDKIFFHQLMACSKDDSYDLILACQKRMGYNFFEDIHTAKRIFFCFVLYDTACFLKNYKTEKEPEEIKEQIKTLFAITPERWRFYKNFLDEEKENTAEFNEDFVKAAFREIFGIELRSPVELAFMNNLFYNSYKGFIESYTKYIPLGEYERKGAELLGDRVYTGTGGSNIHVGL